MPDHDLDLYAKCEAKTYTVTFYECDGETVFDTEVVDFGALVPDPGDPTGTGYTFAGWFTEKTHNNEWNLSTDTMPDHDLDLYAKCEAQLCSITVVKELHNCSGCDFSPYPGSPWEFSITGGATPSPFYLPLNNDWLNNSQLFDNLNPGTYTIKETEKWGYSCSIKVEGTSKYTENKKDCSVKIILEAGDNVTVTFTNSKCYNKEKKQHILIEGSNLLSLVEEHSEGVLAKMTLSQPNKREAYFTVELKDQSGSSSQTGLKGWCLTKDYTISNGTHDVILFPISAYIHPYTNDLNKGKICGILQARGSKYGRDPVQNAIWGVTDGITLSGDALDLYNAALEISNPNCGIIAIPVKSCTPTSPPASASLHGFNSSSFMNTSDDIGTFDSGTPVDKDNVSMD